MDESTEDLRKKFFRTERDLKSKLAAKEEELKKYEEELKAKDEQLKKKDELLEEKNEQLQQKDNQAAILKSQIEAITKEASDADNSKKLWISLEKTLKMRIDELTAQLEEKDTKIKESQENFKALETEKNKLSKQNSELNQDIKKKEKQINDLESKLDDINDKVRIKQEEIASIEGSLQEKINENEQLNEDLNSSQGLQQETLAKLEMSEQNLKETKTTLEIAQEELKKCQLELIKEQEETNRMKNSFIIKKGDLDVRYEDQLKRKDEELNKITTELNKVKARIVEEVSKANEQIKKKNSTIQQLQNDRKNNEEFLSSLDNKFEETYKNWLAKLNDTLNKLEKAEVIRLKPPIVIQNQIENLATKTSILQDLLNRVEPRQSFSALTPVFEKFGIKIQKNPTFDEFKINLESTLAQAAKRLEINLPNPIKNILHSKVLFMQLKFNPSLYLAIFCEKMPSPIFIYTDEQSKHIRSQFLAGFITQITPGDKSLKKLIDVPEELGVQVVSLEGIEPISLNTSLKAKRKNLFDMVNQIHEPKHQELKTPHPRNKIKFLP